MEHIDLIFSKYETDKSSKFHNYSRQYEELLKPFRTSPITFLELGVYHGGSIKAFREVFKDAVKIVGVDIHQYCKQYENKDKNIYIEIGDVTDKEFIDNLIQQHGPFDIIIDDASHINRNVIQSFELLFPSMNDNGLYIVEDTSVINDSSFIDPKYPSHTQYFYNYVKFINQWRFHSTEGIIEHCSDPFTPFPEFI